MTEIFIAPSSLRAKLIIFIAIGVIFVTTLHLIQPYYWHPMNRIRSGLYFTFTGASGIR